MLWKVLWWDSLLRFGALIGLSSLWHNQLQNLWPMHYNWYLTIKIIPSAASLKVSHILVLVQNDETLQETWEIGQIFNDNYKMGK